LLQFGRKMQGEEKGLKCGHSFRPEKIAEKEVSEVFKKRKSPESKISPSRERNLGSKREGITRRERRKDSWEYEHKKELVAEKREENTNPRMKKSKAKEKLIGPRRIPLKEKGGAGQMR